MRRAPSMLDRYARDVLLRWRTQAGCRPLNSGRLSGPRIHHCSRKTFASLSITATGVIWAICRRQIEIAGDRLGVHRRVTSRTGRAYSICRSSISAGFVLVRTSSIVARVTRHHQNHGQLALALFRISCVVWHRQLGAMTCHGRGNCVSGDYCKLSRLLLLLLTLSALVDCTRCCAASSRCHLHL